jgi:hypothetical protein
VRCHSISVHGASVRSIHMPLPCVPASDVQRVRNRNSGAGGSVFDREGQRRDPRPDRRQRQSTHYRVLSHLWLRALFGQCSQATLTLDLRWDARFGGGRRGIGSHLDQSALAVGVDSGRASGIFGGRRLAARLCERSNASRGVGPERMGALPNKWLQLTVQLVTPFAGAKGAPSCPAAEPGC